MTRPGSKFPELSRCELALLHHDEIAYIKPVVVDGAAAFAVFLADGRELDVLPRWDAAVAAVRRFGLAPARVH